MNVMYSILFEFTIKICS